VPVFYGNKGQFIQQSSEGLKLPVILLVKQGIPSLKEKLLCHRRIRLIVVLILLSAFNAFGQEAQKPEVGAKPPVKAEPAKHQSEKTADKPQFSLSVRTKPILSFSLKAEKVKLVDIAAEMSRRLKTPVLVGPTLQNEVISIEFSDLTLEPAMQLMSPAVYIDYEIETGSGLAPKPLGIYFWTTTGEPPVTPAAAGSNQSLLIEGDTEEGVEPQTDEDRKRQEEQPLRVEFQNNILSVKAKKQPLVFVLLKIGEELGIPVDIQYETKDVIDTEISKLSVEDVVRKLSPNIRLFIRADLLHSERRALRLVLTDPTKTAQQGS